MSSLIKQKGIEYVCLTCGEEIYDDTWNPYIDQPEGIMNDSIRHAAILHCLNNNHPKMKISGTDAILTARFI